jgi:NADPH:quinone reductase-like Zn-dependent oxidoreductase
VDIEAFSINYADICIRWGLYESALRYVGFPIVPGFDFSGQVRWAGKKSGFAEGDKVFGFSLFGAYSDVVLVPNWQIHKTPSHIGSVPFESIPKAMSIIAGVPAVAATGRFELLNNYNHHLYMVIYLLIYLIFVLQTISLTSTLLHN